MIALLLAFTAPPLLQEWVFPLHPQHNHAPGIAELPSGELLLSWYRGSGERTADDVAVFGSRKPVGGTWSEPFVLADTPGFPDGNTALFVDPAGKLWLFWPLVLANTWESCLTQYRTAADSRGPGCPKWDWQGQLALKPRDFEPTLTREFDKWLKRLPGKPPAEFAVAAVRAKAADKLLQRLGWQTRCKPVVLKSGRWLLPLYSDTFSAGLMAITDDAGKTWTASQPLAGFGSIQPTLFEKKDGTVAAYMRENGPHGKVRVCESADGGLTWGSVGESSLVNPGSGLDGVKLADGRWLLVHNDLPKGRHRLAVSLSDDEGQTWKWTRYLADDTSGRFHYPACVQAKDGTVHVTYSTFLPGGKTMTHAHFPLSWVTQ